jgi:hypothetical protein
VGALPARAQTAASAQRAALMDFERSPRTQKLLARLSAFHEHEIDQRSQPKSLTFTIVK